MSLWNDIFKHGRMSAAQKRFPQTVMWCHHFCFKCPQLVLSFSTECWSERRYVEGVYIKQCLNHIFIYFLSTFLGTCSENLEHNCKAKPSKLCETQIFRWVERWKISFGGKCLMENFSRNLLVESFGGNAIFDIIKPWKIEKYK